VGRVLYPIIKMDLLLQELVDDGVKTRIKLELLVHELKSMREEIRYLRAEIQANKGKRVKFE
jgi:hypothetical protein